MGKVSRKPKHPSNKSKQLVTPKSSDVEMSEIIVPSDLKVNVEQQTVGGESSTKMASDVKKSFGVLKKKQTLKKIDKRKLKRNKFVGKLQQLSKTASKLKQQTKLEQTPVVGNIGALGDALPTLESLLQELQQKSDAVKEKKENKKKKGTAKLKARQRNMLSDIELFRQLQSSPAYQANPGAAITQKIQQTLQQENENRNKK